MLPKQTKQDKLARQINALLFKFTRGSVVELRRPCTRKICKACKSGRKHPAWYLSISERGGTRLTYLPRDKVKAVRAMTRNWRKLKELMKELAGMNMRTILEIRKEIGS